jgi:hypothetical protein
MDDEELAMTRRRLRHGARTPDQASARNVKIQAAHKAAAER